MLLLSQIATKLSSRGWVDTVPDLIHILNCGSAGNRTCDLMVKSDTLTIRPVIPTYIYIYIYKDLYSQAPSIHSQTPKMSILCHIFFQVFGSHEVRHLVLPWLLRSSSSPPTVSIGKSSLANDYLPFWGCVHTILIAFFEFYLKLIVQLAFCS